jgi:hypothetical protein
MRLCTIRTECAPFPTGARRTSANDVRMEPGAGFACISGTKLAHGAWSSLVEGYEAVVRGEGRTEADVRTPTRPSISKNLQNVTDSQPTPNEQEAGPYAMAARNCGVEMAVRLHKRCAPLKCNARFPSCDFALLGCLATSLCAELYRESLCNDSILEGQTRRPSLLFDPTRPSTLGIEILRG